MLKSLKKHSYRFVVVLLLLLTLLTFDVGRVTKVEAAATTAAIAGGALLATGAIYLGYLALTGAEVSIPSGTGAEIQNYLKDVGSKVAYYTSGASLYGSVYSYLRENGLSALTNYDVQATRDFLIDMYNDFKDIFTNQEIQSFERVLDVIPPSTNFNYSFTVEPLPTQYYSYGNYYPLTNLSTYTLVYGDASNRLVFYVNGYANLYPIWETRPVRNYTNDGTHYGAEVYSNGSWVILSSVDATVHCMSGSSYYYYLKPWSITAYELTYGSDSQKTAIRSDLTYPPLADATIHDYTTGEDIEVIPVSDTEVINSPNYPNNMDDDNNNYPIVPYVQLPNNNMWGFNLGDLITEIVNRGGQLLTASAIGELINRFKNSLVGTQIYNDYSAYNEGDTYYIDYYYNTYSGDDYVTYNINVSDQEDVIPVDLNTIKQYTNNQYLTVIKERAESFGETFGELVAFWHNCDPEIVYAFLGASIIVLLGAFIGKWGHS